MFYVFLVMYVLLLLGYLLIRRGCGEWKSEPPNRNTPPSALPKIIAGTFLCNVAIWVEVGFVWSEGELPTPHAFLLLFLFAAISMIIVKVYIARNSSGAESGQQTSP
jgi:hypothetical protein